MSEESKTWYTMTRPLFNSGFEDDEFWAYGQDGFAEVLDSCVGSDVEIYDKTLEADPERVRAIIQGVTADVYNSTTVRQMLCKIGVLHCGQYVKHDGGYWLVSAMPDNNRIYEKAVLWKCKHSIRFISPTTGKIVEYPVYSQNSTQYGTGLAEKDNLTVGDDQHLVYLPYNQETIRLDVDFRFLMDKNRENPSAYRVTRVDPVSYAVGDESADDGLIQWAVEQTQFNEATDSREEMVADYYPDRAPAPPEQEGGTLTLTDEDGDGVLVIGETKTISVTCLAQDGSLAGYRMEYNLGGAADVLDAGDDRIVLAAKEGTEYIGRKITVRAVSDALGLEAEMEIRIAGW